MEGAPSFDATTAMSGRPAGKGTMSRSRSWALTVLVLLAGLLGMHAVGAGHAGMTGMTATAAHQHQAAGHTPAPGDLLAAPAAPALSDATAAMAHGWCLAVLTASLLLLLRNLLRRRRSRPASPVPRSPVPCSRRVTWRPSPPDLVAGLCVSRT